MLLIFIGPLISQAMPMEHHTGMQMPMSAAVDMPSHHAAEHNAEHGSHHQAPPADASADHALWAKCGYCTLLFSCPALTRTLDVVSLPAPNPADFFNATPQPGHARSSVFPNARSRAPPLTVTR